VPSSGIAAPAPSKVRTVVSTTKIDMWSIKEPFVH
jgi:hypothetical protein